MEQAISKVDACNYNELSKHTPIFNAKTLGTSISVYLKPEVARDLDLYQLDDISTDTVEVPVTGFVTRTNVCWFDILTSILDRTPGHHIYRMSLINKRNTQETVFQYFAYIIQDDNPNKPYVYMDKTNSSLSGCSHCCMCNANKQ